MTLQGELTKKYQSDYQGTYWLDEIKFGEIQRDYVFSESEYRYKGLIIEHKEPTYQYTRWSNDHGGFFIGLDIFSYKKQSNRFDGSIV